MECYAHHANDELLIGNRLVRRRFRWNHGHLVSLTLEDLSTHTTWPLTADTPDAAFFGADPSASTVLPAHGSFHAEQAPATASLPERLLVTVETRLGALQVRRVFRIYDDCPAIACDFYLRHAEPSADETAGRTGGRTAEPAAGRTAEPAAGSAAGRAAEPTVEPAAGRAAGQAADQANASVEPEPAVPPICTLDSLHLPGAHYRLTAVEFFDVTDRNNNLVRTTTALPYRGPAQLRGNLLFIEPLLGGAGLFVLKEAPSSSVQLAYPGYDFGCLGGAMAATITVVGTGVVPGDLGAGEWTRAYGVVVGVCPADELGRLSAVRTYQEQIRSHQPKRDDMILMNTWGDRSQDSRMGEDFALAEIEAGARLGVTHLQLDDGWQSGRSSNSAFEGGSLEGIWDAADYWNPHPERFPAGLQPVVDRGRECQVEICLWFNPSQDEEYAHWREDADTLIRLHREHGIRTFKIDGVQVPTKRAETRLRRMFDTVVAATGGEAVFNLDVTAGQRYGYHCFNEYGNIFLENRYTDMGSYFPHWTLRNLWMLARYVPPHNLQVEFLNCWRNADRYAADDPLAPCRVPFDYCFAITMVAQPLAWFEATGLPEEAFAIAPLVRTCRQHQERIHAGRILPIGAEPSGASWTGFQSLREDGGYLLVFRECAAPEQSLVDTFLPPGHTVRCTPLAGAGEAFTASTDEASRLPLTLPAPHAFALYEYACS